MKIQLRAWQQRALDLWRQNDRRGIVSVVTGGGKTVYALACIEDTKAPSVLVVVPTLALLDQWWEESASYFGLGLDEINILGSHGRIRSGTVNIAVINSAARLSASTVPADMFLVVDECHRAAASKFKDVLALPHAAALGLSATPERPYDDGLNEILVPALGRVIFEYTYREALSDGVIVPFLLKNIVFDLEPDRQEQYDKLTKSIARSVAKFGMEAPETVRLFLRRARILSLSMNRVRLALKLVARHRQERVLVFHEDIAACTAIHTVLAENGARSGVYHSRLPTRERAEILGRFRRGDIEILVTCRALDEGFNVPEAQVGIIAASTATRRQRIQRLGRILRPAKGKQSAIVYSLAATAPEVARLKQEEADLEGVAEVAWGKA